uniref:Diphosphoinositol polyphosphate phosphohydrolase 3-beta-like n=1 Tax=Sinocyclocheilus anshuiensis TaxID=1608454 RepID=A0A671KW09_9TELE
MASWVCNADPIAADLRRLRRAEEPQQSSHSTKQPPWSRREHPNSQSPLSREELCLHREALLINANCMISLENLGRLSALGLKGSCVARRIQKLGNREHLYSCFVRRKPHMMKFKPNQTRTYDGEGFKKRAACLCFKNDREDEVLLVSSSRHPDQWIVPGGGMEPEEEPGGAAVREVYEEVGSGNGSRSKRRSGCYSATNLSTLNISANSLLTAALRTATLRSLRTRLTTPPSIRQPHMTVDCPVCTDRTATRGHRCKGNLDWTGKDSYACIISMFTI